MGLAIGVFFYVAWLLLEVFKANLQVLVLSFSPKVEERISPRIVEFRSLLADDYSRFLLALSITLTPGTVTIRIDGDRFIVHALTEKMAEAVPGSMETRLLKLFGGKEVVADA